MSQSSNNVQMKEANFNVKERLLTAVSLFSVTNSCGSRCEVFNPAYDFADPKVANCYHKCVGLYRDLRGDFEQADN